MIEPRLGLLLQQFEVSRVRQPGFLQHRVIHNTGQHPHGAVIGVFHGVAIRVKHATQVSLRPQRDALHNFGPPFGTRIIPQIIVHGQNTIGKGLPGSFQRQKIVKPVYIFHGVAIHRKPVSHLDTVAKLKLDTLAFFQE